MKYYPKMLFIIAFAAIPFLAGAQKQIIKDTTSGKIPLLKVAYMGTIIYPGFKMGMDWPTNSLIVTKTKRHGEKAYVKEKCLGATLSMYYHENFHTNLFMLAERQWRRISLSGFYTELAPGIGVSRTFLGGTTYQANDAGIVSKKNMAGYTYAMVSISSGLGYDFRKSAGKPFRVYAAGSVLMMFPYNSYIYIRPTVEIGFITNFSLFQKKYMASHE